MEWQPIETVPVDGTMVLVYMPDREDRKIQTGFANLNATKNVTWVIAGHFGFDIIGTPTQWMPLPEAPKDNGK